ncbi:hypothetical protein GQ602_002176 [Ophiocordyceps camponoti-floridani]|uniref:Fucose-specific lectin n=1 Tax=Ophiocordyceps camponoti-floridani TaxID=2030778 RepID=A0A8H4Q9V9_9HYPO|nr:hypothetical protein GQ602_002176 [Ophiocordyceps camponoti-floridani]
MPNSPAIPPCTGKVPSLRPDIIHNHYYTTNPKALPWYRRKPFFWTAIAVLVFIVVAAAVSLGVVLKLELGKSRMRVDHQTSSSPPATDQNTSSLQTMQPSQTRTSDTSSGAMSSTAGVSSKSSSPSSTTSTETAAATPSVIFTVSEKSRLASVYVEDEQANLHRRFLAWQDDKGHLIVTEWSAGNRSHYRIRDQLRSRIPDAKLGSPLAMAASPSGVVHLFFLDTQDALSHVFRSATGVWETRTLRKGNGPVIASGPSPLSTAWHRTGDGTEVLAIAYANSQDLRLAMTDGPTAESPWLVSNVVSLPGPVPGQLQEPCFAVAGDWRNAMGARTMLMAVLMEDGLFAYECPIEMWPPGSKTPCRQLNDTFRDDKDRDVSFVPPPKQLGWIRLDGHHSAGYDFSLVGLGEDGFISENRIGADEARRAGHGLETRMAARAISATDEAVLFAAAGDDIYMYRLDVDSGTWRAEGSLQLTSRGRTA